MSNVHGLFSNRNDEDSDDERDNNNRFVGGIDSRGGGRYGWMISFLFFLLQFLYFLEKRKEKLITLYIHAYSLTNVCLSFHFTFLSKIMKNTCSLNWILMKIWDGIFHLFVFGYDIIFILSIFCNWFVCFCICCSNSDVAMRKVV